MATYTRRNTTVNAVQHFGASTPISSHLKGDQVAKSGDFLVVDPIAVAAIRAQEKLEDLPANSLGNKGTIYVIAKDQFLADFDATDATPGLAPNTGFNVPDALDVNAPAVVEPVVEEPAK